MLIDKVGKTIIDGLGIIKYSDSEYKLVVYNHSKIKLLHSLNGLGINLNSIVFDSKSNIEYLFKLNNLVFYGTNFNSYIFILNELDNTLCAIDLGTLNLTIILDWFRSLGYAWEDISKLITKLLGRTDYRCYNIDNSTKIVIIIEDSTTLSYALIYDMWNVVDKLDIIHYDLSLGKYRSSCTFDGMYLCKGKSRNFLMLFKSDGTLEILKITRTISKILSYN